MLSSILLGRIQFALNITFHILFPSITIGLAWVLLFLRYRYYRTKDESWLNAYRLWVKIFALSFAMGVVSGVTMSFQFGTNWPGFMEKAGNIAGPLLAYEVLTAFFLEASFLGIMLFGSRKVSDRIHLFSTLMVAIGTSLSAFWIMVLNSWMQTPSGWTMVEGRLMPADWGQIIWNPSMFLRLSHMLLASGITCAFLMIGVSSYRMLLNQKDNSVAKTLQTGLIIAAVLLPLQLIGGDRLGLNTLAHQPAKLAAIEAVWKTEKPVPLTLFGIPDAKSQSNLYAITIPRLGSIILTHTFDGEIKGIEHFPGQTPPVAPVFFSFRIMVGTWVLMFLLITIAGWQWYHHKSIARPVLIWSKFMAFSGWLATVAGWYVSEIGRQPFLIYGLLLTKDAASSVPSAKVGVTLVLYLLTYTLLLASYIYTIFYMARTEGKTNTPFLAKD